MDILYKKGPAKICEVWFNELHSMQALKKKYSYADIIILNESCVAASPNSIAFRNGILDIEQDSDELFLALNSGFRNEVRRAKKEGIANSPCSPLTLNHLAHIYDTYKKFCHTKKILPLPHSLMQHYANSNHLFYSEASIDSTPIHTHIYISDIKEVILLASFPLRSDTPNKIAGWANRGLHWADIISFKEVGIIKYNLGGIGNPVTENNRSIVAFKRELNPNDATYFQDTIAVSPLGWLYLLIKKCLK